MTVPKRFPRVLEGPYASVVEVPATTPLDQVAAAMVRSSAAAAAALIDAMERGRADERA